MTQITEDYVSYEVAKLLKEKGFDEKVHTFYISETEIVNTNIKHNYNGESIYLSVPTHQRVMKWLKKTHNYVINVNYIDFLEIGEVWSYVIIDKSTFAEYYKDTENSYEEACEAAIKYCLENLI